MAELIKTALLDASNDFLNNIKTLKTGISSPDFPSNLLESSVFLDCIARSIAIKGRIVEADPKETGTERVLLNLGHTFGHALEASLGLGTISHGEAVAWGISRSVELGCALGITEQERAKEILEVLKDFGYETRAGYSMDKKFFMDALLNDKKKKSGKLTFIIPALHGAQVVSSDKIKAELLEQII
jgi:3-dehydroquinate synthase